MTKSSTAARADGLERELAEQTTGAGPCRGVSLVGPGGLLSGVAKDVLETARERTEHLGYEPRERVGADNTRNGYRAKTVLTEVGPVEVNCDRIRDLLLRPACTLAAWNQRDWKPRTRFAAHGRDPGSREARRK